MQSIALSANARVAPSIANRYGALALRKRHMGTKHSKKAIRTPAAKPTPLEYIPTPRKSSVKATLLSSAPESNPLPFASRKLPLILAGCTALIISSYCGYLVVTYKKAIADGAKEIIPEDVSHRYDVIAPSFDKSVEWTEKLMGMNKLRKKMAQEALGDVCEVSIGTGRNLTFYEWNFPGFNGVGMLGATGSGIKKGKVKSFTAVDKSAEMLEVAHDKFSKEYPGIIGVRWVIQDAAQALPPPPVFANESNGNKAGKKYDTIIQTMGLCSTSDPVRLLQNLGESVEEDGRILLLEHGKSTWDLINTYLDGLAARHAREFGCVWNKDIGKIVEESGLDVVKIERKHFGTTWWIELRPKRRPVTHSIEGKPIESQIMTKAEVQRGKSSWFWSA